MAKRPALDIALDNPKLEETDYRSSLEARIAKQLTDAGIEFEYEGERIPYSVPAREAKYTPDFTIHGNGIIIEGKGHFGANNFGRRFSNMKEQSAKERQKFALLKEQHPDLDIRFVFQRAAQPIYKGSPTSHAKWAEDHGFPWAEKVVPSEWLAELKRKRKKQ
jgi:hypothetical protein